MEGVFQFLLVTIVTWIITKQVKSINKPDKKQVVTKRKVTGQDFTDTEGEDDDTYYEEWEEEKAQVETYTRSAFSASPSQTAQKAKPTASSSPTKRKGSTPRIRLRTPEDARRAFIYSEIFNRKY